MTDPTLGETFARAYDPKTESVTLTGAQFLDSIREQSAKDKGFLGDGEIKDKFMAYADITMKGASLSISKKDLTDEEGRPTPLNIISMMAQSDMPQRMNTAMIIAGLDMEFDNYPMKADYPRNALGQVGRALGGDTGFAFKPLQDFINEAQRDGVISREERLDFAIVQSSISGDKRQIPAYAEDAVKSMLESKKIEATPERVEGLARDIQRRADALSVINNDTLQREVEKAPAPTDSPAFDKSKL